MRATFVRIVPASAVLVLALGGVLVAQGPGAQPSSADDPAREREVLRQAMKSKLKHTQDFVAALAIEDFERLGDSARSLRQIGQDALWKVSPNLTYVKYSAEFVAVADELARRAKENDLNGVTLSYVR